jgi:hypothetical protein
MRNAVALMSHLKNEPLCDDCLSELTGIEPRQAVNAYCRKLSETGTIIRQRGECSKCRKEKYVNALSKAPASTVANATQDPIFPAGQEEKRNEKWLQEWVFMELYAYFRGKASSVHYRQDGSFFCRRFERLFMIHKEAELEYGPGGTRTVTHKTDLLLSVLNPKTC